MFTIHDVEHKEIGTYMGRLLKQSQKVFHNLTL